MRKMLLFLFAICVFPVWASGVHVDDIEYQKWLDKMQPYMTSMIQSLEFAKNAADEVDDVDGNDTIPELCAKLFPTSGTTTCDTAGEEHYDITDSLRKLMNQATQMHNCANNLACAQNPRLTRLRRNSNEVYGVTLDADASKYQPMFDNMISTSRTLLSTLLNTNIINELANEVEGSKTATQLCAQLFAPNELRDCTVGGGTDKEINRTQDLIDASAALDDLYDCADDVACGTGDRFTDLRKFVEVQ